MPTSAWTPISPTRVASRHSSLPLIKGHASVVTLLLADERLDPNIADQDGNTALTCAALNRCDSVVKLLLADEPTTLFSSGSLMPLLPGPQHHRAKRKLAASREIQVLRIRVQKGIGDSGEPGLPLWLQIWLPSWLHNSQPARGTWGPRSFAPLC